jgi:hypothetical protein
LTRNLTAFLRPAGGRRVADLIRLTVTEGNPVLNHLATVFVAAPAMRYCGQCTRPAVLFDSIAELASYVCPLQHLTLLDLTKLNPQRPRPSPYALADLR